MCSRLLFAVAVLGVLGCKSHSGQSSGGHDAGKDGGSSGSPGTKTDAGNAGRSGGSGADSGAVAVDGGGTRSSTDAGTTAADGGSAAPIDGCTPPTGSGKEHSGNITQSETWTLADSPHIVTYDLYIKQGMVTIEPCAVVRVQEGYTIVVGGTAGSPDASLVAKGTRERGPKGTIRSAIKFVPDRDGTRWGSLLVYETGHLQLESVDLSDGGNQASAQMGATIVAQGAAGPGLTRSVSVIDVSIARSEGAGVSLRDFAAFTADSNQLTITGSGQAPSQGAYVTDYPILIQPPGIGTIPPGTYTGNKIDAIYVLNAAVAMDETFPSRGVPYAMQGGFAIDPANSGGELTLTLEAGVTLQFATNPTSLAFLKLGHSSSSTDVSPVKLIANGTADAPIVLTSVEKHPVAGDWGGIAWQGGPPDGNSMQYVRIEYAGGKSGTTGFGCGPANNSAALTITNWRPADAFIMATTISDSAGGGIVSGWASDLDGPNLKDGNTFINIANGCDVSQWAKAMFPACPDNGPTCL